MVEITSLKSRLESKTSPILGLDAYGVIYNDCGIFDTIPAVFDYCHQQGIPIVMMTNNATQSIDVIYNKMAKVNLTLPKPNIISSGCGLIDLPNLNAKVKNKRVFVYGYESSRQYVIDAGGVCVDDPANAEVIVMAASITGQNHFTYRNVFLALKQNPTIPVICINPDHYVRYANGFLSVMGFYAQQMAAQLNRSDFIWMGKPSSLFSDLTRARFNSLGFDPKQLVFCDDNPFNVVRVSTDLACEGVVVTTTGVFSKYQFIQDVPDQVVQISKCKI